KLGYPDIGVDIDKDIHARSVVLLPENIRSDAQHRGYYSLLLAVEHGEKNYIQKEYIKPLEIPASCSPVVQHKHQYEYDKVLDIRSKDTDRLFQPVPKSRPEAVLPLLVLEKKPLVLFHIVENGGHLSSIGILY